MAVELQGRGQLRRAAAVAALALVPAIAGAQPAPSINAAYEASYDRFHYYFENPSTFDTGELVPHNFTQTYWADNHWLVVSGTYRLAGQLMETSAAVTPSRETRGDDVDAFFLRSGDVATSGTSGRVDLRSLRVRHDVAFGSARGITWHGGYQYRRDRSEFHARQIKTVTHSRPPSSDSFPIDGAETTISDVHAVHFGISREWAATAWRVRARLDAAPTTYARLTTMLALKYPGREIVFSAPVLTINPSLEIARGARWPLAVTVSAIQTFRYTEARRFHRRAVFAAIRLGRSG